MISLGLLLTTLMALGTAQKSPGQLYEQARFLEESRGDLQAAIKLYDHLARQFSGERRIAARALLRLGMCYERLGLQGATQAYQTLIDKFGDQAEARIARQKLAVLTSAKAAIPTDFPTGFSVREITFKNGEKIRDDTATLSPDGKHVVYADTESSSLVVYNLLTGESRRITQPEYPTSPWFYRWSADGKKVAYNLPTRPGRIGVTELQSGLQSVFYERPEATVLPIDWTADGQSLLCWIMEKEGHALAIILEGGQPLRLIRLERSAWSFRMDRSNKYVAYISGDTDPEIHVMSLIQPGDPIVIASNPATDDNPIWSPDGRYLAFRSNRASSWDLWGVEIHEGKAVGVPFLVQKDIGSDAWLQDWLPDGRLTFNKREVLNDIWVVPVDPYIGNATGKAFLISLKQGKNSQPTWSPDGKFIAFGSSRGGKRRLIITRVDDLNEREVDLSYDRFQNPVWSPTNKIVLFALQGRLRTLLEYDPVTEQSRTFLEYPHGGIPHPDFAPDGSLFLFESYDEDPQKSGLYIYDGLSVRRIPGTEEAGLPRWSPDGRWISFLRARALWLMKPDGTVEKKLVQLTEKQNFQTYAWSPDSRLIAFPRWDETNPKELWTLWVVSIDGQIHKRIDTRGYLPEGVLPWWLDWSPDGQRLALGTSTNQTGLWVMENFWPKKP